MIRTVWKRAVSMALALMLLIAAPITAEASQRFTLIQLKGTDVVLDEIVFTYTGEEIRPNVTVRVDDTLLTLDKDYTLSFADNIEIGTGRVIVTGIATASETMGYTGTVEIPFTINAPAPYELKGTDVTIEGTSFPYTGSYIEPKVTVTVEGKELVREQDYTLRYHNNLAAGTATASVTGIEAAGYTGQVNIPFTIEPDQTVPETTEPETTEPETSEPEATEPETSEPEATEPETNAPETNEPEATEPEAVAYKITKGNKASWYRESTKTLAFTANGKRADFVGVKVDGKELKEDDYILGTGNTTVTLMRAFLKSLKNGSHTITILFEDGEATGTFRVAEGLDTTNPETGDSIGLWISLMGLTASAAMGLILFRKKLFL